MGLQTMKEERIRQDVCSIVTADAPYAGNVMRIPSDIQQKARQLCWKYNMTDPSAGVAQAAFLKELLGTWNENVAIMPHVHFDYGINTHFAGGHVTFVNFDCVFLARQCLGLVYLHRDMLAPNERCVYNGA